MIESKKFIRQANSSKWQNKLKQNSYSLTLADIDIPFYKPFHQKFVQKMVKINNFTYKQRGQEYFQSFIKWHAKHYIKQKKCKITASDIVASLSVCNLFACSILAFTKPQDYILIITPTYSFYKDSIFSAERKVVFTQMNLKKVKNSEFDVYGYQLNLEDFKEKMMKFKPRILTLCNPHNPGGKIFTKEQINCMVEQAKKIDCIIFSDQILADFAIFRSQNVVPFYSLINSQYPKIIVGNSIGKSFNCSSIQGGYGIIRCKNLRQKYTKISNKLFKLLTNQIAEIMTPIVYSQDGQNWLKQINSLITKNYLYFIQKTKSTKLKIITLESTYLMVISFQNYLSIAKNMNASQIKKKLISKNIYLLNMDGYFEPTKESTFYRVAIGVDSQFFIKFTNKLLETLSEIDQGNTHQAIVPKL